MPELIVVLPTFTAAVKLPHGEDFNEWLAANGTTFLDVLCFKQSYHFSRFL
jgi:hypothetical protein